MPRKENAVSNFPMQLNPAWPKSGTPLQDSRRLIEGRDL